MAKRYDVLPPDLANHNAAKCWLSDRFDIGQALLSAGETPVKFHYDAIIWNRNSTLWDLVVGHRTVWWIDVQYICRGDVRYLSLRWRHNENDCVSNHQPHHCLLNRFIGCRSKKISKLRVTGLCAGNSTGTGEFPAQRASDAENVSIWLRHHVIYKDYQINIDIIAWISYYIQIKAWLVIIHACHNIHGGLTIAVAFWACMVE